MISHLKEICGFEYTSKLQRMFNDVRLSLEFNQGFGTSAMGSSIPFSFSALILQSGSWPITSSAVPLPVLPSPLGACVEKFDLFYNVGGLHVEALVVWSRLGS
jgi:hypothetical protein